MTTIDIRQTSGADCNLVMQIKFPIKRIYELKASYRTRLDSADIGALRTLSERSTVNATDPREDACRDRDRFQG
jgi:hypothetical protein